MKCMIIAPAHPEVVLTDAPASAYALFTHVKQHEHWNTLFVAAGEGGAAELDPRPIRRHRGRPDEYILTLPALDGLTQFSSQPDRAFGHLEQLIELHRPELVHLHQGGALGLSVLAYLKGCGIKVVLTLHGSLALPNEISIRGRAEPLRASERFIRDRLIAEQLRAADLVIAASSALARDQIDAGLVAPDHITVLRSPFGFAGRLNGTPATPSSPPRLLAVVDPSDKPAVDVLSGTIQDLQRMPASAPLLDLMGVVDEGSAPPLSHDFDERFKQSWRGAVPAEALVREFIGYDGLVLPGYGPLSMYFGLSALIQGVPVIADEASGLGDALKPPSRGWVFPSGSSAGLSRIVREVADGRRPLPVIDQDLVRDEDALALAAHVSLYRALRGIRRHG